MIPATPSAERQLEFLRQLQRLLDEGSFVATYKYALLHAIADLCVIHGDDTGAPLTLSTQKLADQFVRLYWRQASPFPAAETDRPLRQNTGRQAAIVNIVREARATYSASLGRVERSEAWDGIIGRVELTVRRMPLWKLQTIGNQRVEFLYENREDENPREVVLKPGVAYCFRGFYSLITEMVQGAWTQHIRRTNSHLLGTGAELRYFLFGTERRDLTRYREVLEDLQSGRCFYCQGPFRSDAIAVDHFVPWRRYPFDLGHNFVLAHDRCNSRKGDRLAAVQHLRNWAGRNQSNLYELERRFNQAGGELKRLPSEVYWGGLGSWGIRRFDASRERYHRALDETRSTRLAPMSHALAAPAARPHGVPSTDGSSTTPGCSGGHVRRRGPLQLRPCDASSYCL